METERGRERERGGGSEKARGRERKGESGAGWRSAARGSSCSPCYRTHADIMYYNIIYNIIYIL